LPPKFAGLNLKKKTKIGELMADINGKETWLGFGEMENEDRIRKWKFCHDGLL